MSSVRTQRRIRDTRNFVDCHLDYGSNILVIGEISEVERRIIGDSYRSCELIGTRGDLNSEMWQAECEVCIDAVFCFEVIEHLVNPLTFLERLKGLYLTKETKVFVTFPRNPGFLWGKRHFHEYDKMRFETLIRLAGYKVIRYDWKRGWAAWYIYFCGIRPVLRFVMKLIGLSRHNFYYLKIR